MSEKEEGVQCGVVPKPAVMGINRVWLDHNSRRLKIATKLLDAARTSFMFGAQIPINSVAFSDPTKTGRLFAASYAARTDFLVYQPLPV